VTVQTEILRLLRGGVGHTPAALAHESRCDGNVTKVKRALAGLEKQGLVHQSHQHRGYALTPLGRRYANAIVYMERHFTRAVLVDIAAAAGLSMFHFHRTFSGWLGQTPKDFLLECQIARAKELLREGVAPAAIARKCGFAHQSHLTSRFHVAVGMAPVHWLKAQERCNRR